MSKRPDKDTGRNGTKGNIPRSETTEFERFWQVVRTLRGTHGCPWDLEQTTKSIRSNLVEEAYEAIDAISDDDAEHLKEELGDVLLVVMLMACIEQQAGTFTLAEVFSGVTDKLIRRHPHVFGDAAADTSEAVKRQWNDIKTGIEGRNESYSALDGVRESLPPLDRAYKLQKKAAKSGFDWPDIRGALEKLREEVEELEEALDGKDDRADRTAEHVAAVEHEIGDVLFSVVNVARKSGIEPGLSLHEANRRFSNRFQSIERYFVDRDEDLSTVSLERMEEQWNHAKRGE